MVGSAWHLWQPGPHKSELHLIHELLHMNGYVISRRGNPSSFQWFPTIQHLTNLAHSFSSQVPPIFSHSDLDRVKHPTFQLFPTLELE